MFVQTYTSLSTDLYQSSRTGSSQGCYARTMPSMEDAQAQFSQNETSSYPKLYLIKHIHSGISQFSQNEPSGHTKLYLIKHIHCGISWDIPV